jgi:hypothetical protein
MLFMSPKLTENQRIEDVHSGLGGNQIRDLQIES